MKIIIALALLVSYLGLMGAEPVTYPWVERSLLLREIPDHVFWWKPNDRDEIILSTNIMRETLTVYYYPASPYIMVVTIRDYYRVEDGVNEFYATNQFVIYVRAVGRGGGFIGYTNIVQIDRQRDAPGGNLISGSTTVAGMRNTGANSTTYMINNSQDPDKAYDTEFTFQTNAGLVTLKGPRVPAGGMVTYAPSFADATAKLKKNVTQLSLVTSYYYIPLSE
ncbi:MAG: hypothetical protein V4481_04060 [Patescibacteria group bacterium]